MAPSEFHGSKFPGALDHTVILSMEENSMAFLLMDIEPFW